MAPGQLWRWDAHQQHCCPQCQPCTSHGNAPTLCWAAPAAPRRSASPQLQSCCLSALCSPEIICCGVRERQRIWQEPEAERGPTLAKESLNSTAGLRSTVPLDPAAGLGPFWMLFLEMQVHSVKRSFPVCTAAPGDGFTTTLLCSPSPSALICSRAPLQHPALLRANRCTQQQLPEGTDTQLLWQIRS